MAYPDILSLIIVLTLGLLAFVLAVSVVVSFWEREHRAGYRLLAITLILIALIAFAGFMDYWLKPAVAIASVILLLVISFLFIKKKPKSLSNANPIPKRNEDEHDVIFSRMRLQANTPDWENYYSKHPFEAEQDAMTRSLPGLLASKSSFYNPLTFEAARANFDLIDYLHSAINHPVAEFKCQINSDVLTSFLKNWVMNLGAHSVGITELKDYHLYTVRGRGANKGNLVVLQHKYAIAFTVEMNHNNVQAAPASSIILESSQQYLNSATIALQLANCLKGLGYEARAHIDGDYELICPLVAADAGLGEIGRMGLLMTPKLGPRVRIAVVTTNAPLHKDDFARSGMMVEFCKFCKKCAVCCPSQSIPKGEMQEVDGILRWKIDSDLCYRYWCVAGTDCARCISVCPFSHPDNVLHNTIRYLINRSRLVARFAYIADDFLYGRKPKPKKLPDWLRG